MIENEMAPPSPPSVATKKWPTNFFHVFVSEMRIQKGISIPLIAMNLTWFAKIAITTAFLGRLGELPLAGGALGFTFANVTGFSVLSGLCASMEPICGQAYGAKNFKLLHKTLLMAISMLLIVSVPISILWLNVEKILVYFGQQKDISHVANDYLFYLLPDLVVTSLLNPLKSYLSSQNVTVPIMCSSALAVAVHLPINMILFRTKGLQGVSMAVWISDVIALVLLAVYTLFMEIRKGGKWREGGWMEQKIADWIKMMKLSGPCCLTTCLEWWCIEILILLTGRLPNAKQALGVLTIVLNFDYLLYSVMLSLSTCASIRVANELGANSEHSARESAMVSLVFSVVSGLIAGVTMVAARGIWGPVFSHDKGIVKGVKQMLLLMALAEVVNFPVVVLGGIVRGTARPWLGMYSNLGGFYILALPIAVVLAFKVKIGLGGLLLGFLIGMVACLALLLVLVARIDWSQEAIKAQRLVHG